MQKLEEVTDEVDRLRREVHEKEDLLREMTESNDVLSSELNEMGVEVEQLRTRVSELESAMNATTAKQQPVDQQSYDETCATVERLKIQLQGESEKMRGQAEENARMNQERNLQAERSSGSEQGLRRELEELR